MKRMLLPLLTLAVLGACDAAPTAVPLETAEPRFSASQGPVAVIQVTRSKPMSHDPWGIDWFMRHYLSGTSSYDPNGGSITSYYWSSSCVYMADGYSSTYIAEVQPNDTCQINLTVTNNLNQTGHTSIWLTDQPY